MDEVICQPPCTWGLRLATAGVGAAVPGRRLRWRELQRLLATVGPGLVVMLADTDAGCLMTAGQSGATWGSAPASLLPPPPGLQPHWEASPRLSRPEGCVAAAEASIEKAIRRPKMLFSRPVGWGRGNPHTYGPGGSRCLGVVYCVLCVGGAPSRNWCPRVTGRSEGTHRPSVGFLSFHSVLHLPETVKVHYKSWFPKYK